MEITVGIDASKARLDVHLHPLGEHFVVDNDEAGVAGLCVRLLGLKGVQTVGLEASGRYERLAVAALAEAGLPVMVLTRRKCGPMRRRSASAARQIRSMHGSLPCSSKRHGQNRDRCPMRQPRNWRR